jgi:hypothetical protein
VPFGLENPPRQEQTNRLRPLSGGTVRAVFDLFPAHFTQWIGVELVGPEEKRITHVATVCLGAALTATLDEANLASMSSLFAFGARLILLLHFTWIVFVVAGAFFLRHRRWRWGLIHLAAVFYSVAIEVYGWICPLTYLEQWFLRRAGRYSYEGGFITYYVEKLIYLRAPQWLLVSLVLVLLVVTLYLYFWPKRGTGDYPKHY